MLSSLLTSLERPDLAALARGGKKYTPLVIVS